MRPDRPVHHRYIGFMLPRLVLVSTLVVLTACGGGSSSSDDSTADGSTAGTVTEAPTTEPTEPSTTESPDTTKPVTLEQPAIWPGASDVFTTPESVVDDFVLSILGVPPVVGEFMAGDARSGEIGVYSPGEGGAEILRSIILVRQLGQSNGWFIIGTLNDNAMVTSPVSGAEIDADDVSEVVVEGMAEGFEASLTVYAYIAGRTEILDQETTMGGNLGVPGPFQVTLDLSGAQPGDTVMLLVRGGVGLETDPGEFGAIPILIR